MIIGQPPLVFMEQLERPLEQDCDRKGHAAYALEPLPDLAEDGLFGRIRRIAGVVLLLRGKTVAWELYQACQFLLREVIVSDRDL
jgi:hypothetical protein